MIQFEGELKALRPRAAKGKVVEVTIEARADRDLVGTLFDLLNEPVRVELEGLQLELEDGTVRCVLCNGVFVPEDQEIHCPNCVEEGLKENGEGKQAGEAV